MTARPVFTILTATYERRHTLERLYRSLEAQALRSFEWLVVDDGSTDGTEALVKDIASRAPFPVRYVRQDNRGKYIAFNLGVREARADLIVNVDSDDALVGDALLRLDRAWNEIPVSELPGFVGVTGLGVNSKGEIVGDRFRSSPLDSDSQTVGLIDRVRGDKSGVLRRDVLLQYPFPEDLPTKFIPEGRIWLAIGKDFKTRFINEPILTIFEGDHPRLSRLTRINRLHGDYEYYFFALNLIGRDFIFRAPLQVLKLALLGARAGLTLGKPIGRIFSLARGRTAKACMTIAAPFAYLLHMMDMVRAYGELGFLMAITRRLPRGRLMRRAANVLRRIYVRRQRPTVEVPVLDFKMALEPNECVDGWALFYPHTFDWKELGFLADNTPTGGVFIDVGANIGFYSLRMSRHLGSGRVLAIEADPYNCGKLRRNIALSLADNITVFEGGVADRETVLELRLNTTGNRGGNSFAIDTPGERIAVPCLPLAQILRNTGIDRVDSMKLDIEGFEYPVLEAFFEAAPPEVWPKAISIEVVPSLVSTSGDVLQLLRRCGYQQVGRVEDNFLLLRSPPGP